VSIRVREWLNVRLGKASTYGVFAVAHIATRQGDGPVSGKQIAESCGIPEEYLLKILQRLVRWNVVRSERGRSGGFLLRKPAEQTTLLEIVEAVDGPLAGELSARDEIRGASRAKQLVQDVCEEISRHTKSLLGQTTVQQLIEPG
jgi:Rrf2 family protein